MRKGKNWIYVGGKVMEIGWAGKANKPGKATLEELEQRTLEHYEKISLESHEWLNQIPKAIKFYYKWRRIKRFFGVA